MKNRTRITFMLGLLVVGVSVFPYFYLKEKISVPIHDNLDAEVLNYIINAKYLFKNTDVISELMNGLQREWYEVPAPLIIIFYKFFNPFYAYTAAQCFIVFFGYLGMFLLIHEITAKEDEIAFVVAGIFCYLPFYNIYGLSIIGQGILIYGFLNLYKKKKLLISYLFILLFGCSSSLALVGFACIGILLLFIIWLFIIKKIRDKKEFLSGILLLVVTYCFFNFNLLKDLLGMGVKEKSHRTEFKLQGLDFWSQFKLNFWNGSMYTPACNQYIIIFAIVVLLIGAILIIIRKNNGKDKLLTYKKVYGVIVGLFILNVLISIFASLTRVAYVTKIRNDIGGVIAGFQFDRVTWLLSTSWFIILALSLYVIIKDFKFMHVFFRYIISLIFLLAFSWQVYNNSFIWDHLRLMIFPDTYHLTTWEDVYAEDVYQEIKEYIGEDQSTYRVISLGIYPTAALYNGFYCLDGYMNNYSLEYKHKFRKVIAAELERSPYLKQYFDEWGNRCYLMTQESGYVGTIEKTSNFVYKDLKIDTEALKDLDCTYIFSAGFIENAEKLNLKLIRNEAFETESSYYKIYVYKLL